MKMGIMQPYFMPYIGYFQLISAVDVFVVYDNIKYTKKGWINRNRMLVNGTDAMFSLPLKKDSDTLDVVQRELSTDFDRIKVLNQIRGAYASTPQFENTYPVIEQIVNYKNNNYSVINEGYAHIQVECLSLAALAFSVGTLSLSDLFYSLGACPRTIQGRRLDVVALLAA
jgi:hypothetical protein